MDYSLLIGFEEVTQAPSFGINRSPQGFDKVIGKHSFRSSCKKFIYHISIIDYLQSFTFKKQSEIYLKTKFLGAKSSELSSMSPVPYCLRFNKFMKNNVFVN